MAVQWLLPVLISALALGFYDICKKHAVRDNSVMPVLFYSTCFGTAAYVLFLALTGGLAAAAHLSGAEFLLIAFKVLLVGGSWICSYYAIRELPITLASPLRSTSPLWTFFGGVLIFGERLSAMQIAAAAVIFAGYYAFAVCGRLDGFTLRSRAMVLIIAGTLLGSASALYDKYLLNVRQLPKERVQFYFMTGLTVMLALSYLIRRGFGHRHRFEWRWTIPLTGVLLIAADAVYFYALGLPEAPISLIGLLRRMSCVVSFGFGAVMFGERNIRRKLLALALFLIGVLLLSLRR